MQTVSIIIPIYNALEYARQCLASVYRAATRIPFEVIVVDNGSSAPVAAWLYGQKRRHAGLTVLHFDRPLGFARAVNEGAKHARGEYLVLLNSDCMVTDGWLDGVVAIFEADPRIGIVSPVTNHCGPGGQLVSGPPDPAISPSPIDEPQRLFFFCAVIRRRLWDLLGGLDEVYELGTYEDDDFCLRARIGGWRLAVAPCVFVSNAASRTFEENRIDKEEWLFRNETIFLQKASRLSSSLFPAVSGKASTESTSVVVVVPPGASAQLGRSLISLANQTVANFEIVVAVAEAQELLIPAELEQSLRIRRIAADGASLWNSAIAAAQGQFVAFLPAGDIYFPYHLETLHRSLAANESCAAHSGWSVAVHFPSGTMRAPARNYQDWPFRLLIAPWAPLVSWICHRSHLPDTGFCEEFQSFDGWDFAIRMSRSASFETGITCERNRSLDDDGDDARHAELVMRSHPVSEQWAKNERCDFLDAVRDGIWEETLVIKRRERERRARRLFQSKTAPPCPIQQAHKRLIDVSTAQKPAASHPALVDFIFLNILRWDDITQRPHHFAAGLAGRGYRVFWVDISFLPVESFSGTVIPRDLANNVFELRLPGLEGDVYRLGWNPALIALAADALGQIRQSAGISKAVQLVNFPGWTPLAQILRDRFAWPVVYDCLDDQYEFSDLHNQTAAAYEDILTQSCDALITSGYKLHETKRKAREDAVFIPNAADYARFHAPAPRGLLDHLSRPVIGFFGALADWLDSDWIAEAARRYPSWSFVFIGPEIFAGEEALGLWRCATSASNVFIFPKASLADLAAYLAQFDVCTVPFLDLPITRAMHPVKIYEYLAAGKHILAPALPEIQPFADSGLLAAYRDREESFQLLEKLATEPPSEKQITVRTAFALRNDWSERIDRLIEVVNQLRESAA